MITTSIIWAITSTVGAVAVYLLMRAEVRYARGKAVEWRDDRDHQFAKASEANQRAFGLELELNQIKLQRHYGAKKARAAQLARQNATKAARTEKLRQELQASVAIEDRQAA